MQTWYRAAIALAALALLTSPASADKWEPDFEWTLQGGYDYTLDILGEATDGGFSAGTTLGYRATASWILGADFHYNGYGVSDRLTAGFSDAIDIDMSMFELTGFVKRYLNSGSYRLYAKTGGGVFYGRSEVNYQGLQSTGSSYDPGVTGALGFQLDGGRNASTFFEASYRRVLGEDIHWFAFGVGVNFGIW